MNKQLLLCTDLDGTVLPNGPQPESDGARDLFVALAARPEVTLVYVTGRDRQRVSKAIANDCLPQPDLVIGDAGTTIYEVDDDDWQPWHEWNYTAGVLEDVVHYRPDFHDWLMESAAHVSAND